MGILLHFPSERFGAVTRDTEQPHALERLANWIRKSAGIRASATLGCEAAMEQAPNLVPMRHRTRSDTMASAVVAYCHMKGYHGRIVAEAIRVGLMRIKEGKSTASAIESAKVRADFCQHSRRAWESPEGPEAA